MRITDFTVADIRFSTSKLLDGSDAMNPDPDYSAAYVTLHRNPSWTDMVVSSCCLPCSSTLTFQRSCLTQSDTEGI
jgi:hypothetical protein